MPAADKVCVGAIAGAHGVKGVVRIKSFTAVPEDVAAYGPVTDEDGGRTFPLTITGGSRGQVMARIEGVADREAAEALRGVRLYVPRDTLPPTDEDEFYHADLIGLRAEDMAGATLGSVRAVHDYGAGDLLEIVLEDGRSATVPFTRDMVPTVDIAGGRVVIDQPAGLLDEADDAGKAGVRRSRGRAPDR